MKTTARILMIAAAMSAAATIYVNAQDAQAEKTLIANERAIAGALAKGNLAGFKQHVAADGWSIDSMGGRMSVAAFIKDFDTMMKDMKVTSWDISDTQTIWAGADTAILTYKWIGAGTYQGQPIPSPVWCSTVWTKRAGKWTAVFHQESLSMPMPPKK
jgi:hypothetical protein